MRTCITCKWFMDSKNNLEGDKCFHPECAEIVRGEPTYCRDARSHGACGHSGMLWSNGLRQQKDGN